MRSRRLSTFAGILGIALSITGSVPGRAAEIEPGAPVAVSTFLDMIGVQTHMSYSDTAYADRDRVLSALRLLGIDSVRDRVPSGRGMDATKYLAQRGIKFTLTIRAGQTPEDVLKALYDIRRSVPNAVEAVEGYNEIDHGPVTFEGKTGVKGGAAGQAAMYAAVKGDPTFGKLPVYNLTGIDMVKDPEVPWNSLKGFADYGNFHLYPQNGRQPGIWISPRLSSGYSIQGDFPKVISEFGYFTLPKPNVSGFIGVDEKTQAKGIVNGVLDAAKSGIKRIFLYELLDEKPDPERRLREQNFGLFRNDFSPKPSAMALANLRAILTGKRSGNGRTEVKDLTIRSEAADIRALRLSAGGSREFLALWREPPFWDRAAGVPIEVTPVPVSIDLHRPATVSVFDPFTGREATRTDRNTTSSTVEVRDTLVLLGLD
jgi:hypothetical protein